MPIVMIASIALQLFCLVHVFRTGRPYWWAWIILLGSFLGSAVYLIAEVLPELRRSPSARRALRQVQRSIDPERDRRALEFRLDACDTVENRLSLARECLEAGDAATAETLLQQCLKGLHATDPYIMLDLARAQMALADPAAAKQTLDALIAANPGYRSVDGHLLYARSLQQMGQLEAAVEEYAVLVENYPGEEVRVRYGLLLKQLDRHVEARRLFEEVRKRARLSPRHYRDSNREWIGMAESELAGGLKP